MEIKHMELKKYALSDVCTIVPGFAFKSKDFGSGENIAVKIKDIEPPSVNIKNAERVCFTPQDKFRLSEGDYIMAMTGATIGKVGKLQIDAKNVYINQRVCKFNPFTSVCDKEYLYYVLSTSSFRNFIYNNVDSKLAQPNIGHTTIYKYTHLFPSNIKEQKLIASVLNNIDRKIELNKQINDNLEAMARQLYDYWFVQFDFPDEKGKPYKSSGGKMVWNEKLRRNIPEGWSVSNIFDALSVQYGFPFSTELFTVDKTQKPVVRIRDILNNSVSAYSVEEVDCKYRLQKQDLLIGMDGNFHMNYWNDNLSYLNQRSVRLRAKNNSTVSIVQAKYDIQPYIKAREANSKGSTVGHLSDKDLKALYVLVPSKNYYKVQFDILLSMIISNRNENVELSKQRDELLPLLMNGQAAVNYHLYLAHITPTTLAPLCTP
jgi:type I restriction enzyme S subunit